MSESDLEIARKLKDDLKSSQPDIVSEAESILQFAKEQKVTLRLLGGLGVRFVSPSASRVGYSRNYNDIDFVGLKKQSHKIEKLFLDMGYKPRVMFNKLQGDTRLMFMNSQTGRRVDVFLDKFVMCHQFDLKDRLEITDETLAPADLLLTKLQIVEINKKDIQDVDALLVDIPLSEKQREIEKGRILSLTSTDWGIYKTLTLNLDKVKKILPELHLPEKDVNVITEKIDELAKAINDSPKSMAWKMRARVGERVRWYELPETT